MVRLVVRDPRDPSVAWAFVAVPDSTSWADCRRCHGAGNSGTAWCDRLCGVLGINGCTKLMERTVGEGIKLKYWWEEHDGS